ncbi:MAG: SLC13 family permease [Verrucomicrobiota bacterium]
MTPHLASIYVLGAMFLIATLWPVNMGVLAYVGAFLVGTFGAGLSTKEILAGFPGGLFLTLVGITYLFALAQTNGTIDWLVQLSVKAVRGRIAAIPWIMFGITAGLTALGAVSPAAVAIIAPIALRFSFRHGINPLLMGLLVIHGAQAGGFSPISIYGGITNLIVKQAGLPLNEAFTFLASFGVNLAVAIVLFLTMGGRRVFNVKSRAEESMPGAPFGDSGSEVCMEENIGQKGGVALMETQVAKPQVCGGRFYQAITLAGLIVLAVLVLAYKIDVGFAALTIGLVISLIAPGTQKNAIGQVSWPEIMLITGVSTYVAVLEKMGTISHVGQSVATLNSPLWAALLLCFIGAIVSAFASSTAVLGSLIPLAVPFLKAGSGIDAVGFIAAMAVASTIVDVSPFSTNGAIVLATAKDGDTFYRKLIGYGALVTLAAPLILWLLFIVL